MQKNKLNLHIYGIHLLNPYKTVVSHLKVKRLDSIFFAKPKRFCVKVEYFKG